jgi:hypothetical protein
MTRFGLGDQKLRLRLVFSDWMKSDEELWKFLHRGGGGAVRFKNMLRTVIDISGENKLEQHWTVDAGFRIDKGWCGEVANNVERKCSACFIL